MYIIRIKPTKVIEEYHFKPTDFEICRVYLLIIRYSNGKFSSYIADIPAWIQLYVEFYFHCHVRLLEGNY